MQLTCDKCWKAGSELCTPSLMSLVTLLISALKVTSCSLLFGDHNLMKTISFIFSSRRFFRVHHTHVLCWLTFLGNHVQKLSCHNSSETLNKSMWEETWLWQWSQDRMDTSPLMYSIYERHLTDVLVFWFNFQFHSDSRINCRAPVSNWPVSLTS